MDRSACLDRVLARLMGDDLPSLRDALPATAIDDAFVLAVQSLDLSCTGQPDDAQFSEAAGLAGLALTRAQDADALALARAAAGLVTASWLPAVRDPALLDPVSGGDSLLAALDETGTLSAELGGVIRSLLAEAALGCARVQLASEFLAVDGAPPSILFGRLHPYLTFIRVLRARVAAFSGNISAAEVLVQDALAGAATPQEADFARAGSALVLGNADHRTEVRRLIERVLDSPEEPVGALATGCFALAAYGAVALGDVDTAARLVLIAGGNAELSRLRIVDRALGLELLVAAAAATGDLEAAEAWGSRAEPLAEHPISGSTVDRIESRLALLRGDAGRALAAAQRSIDRADEDGRGIESAEAEILLGRARLAGKLQGDGVRQLAVIVGLASERGHFAVQRSAARELRRVGRRLPPLVASGLQGLSSREREVAWLMAEGAPNAAIAAELFLSIHTVRMHVSRVLQAFAVPARAGVAAALAPAQDSAHQAPPALTSRQGEVVALLVSGFSNVRIAQELGIGVTTVEKHVAAILQRWDARSRAGIVRIARAHTSEVQIVSVP